MKDLTLTKLYGSEKQVKWATSLRKKVVDYVLANKEAVASAYIEGRKENLDYLLRQRRKWDNKPKYTWEELAAFLEIPTETDAIINHLICIYSIVRNSSEWINYFKNGITLENVIKITVDDSYEPKHGWAVERMEVAKEHMRCPGCY